jgi:hypothetical protein
MRDLIKRILKEELVYDETNKTMTGKYKILKNSEHYMVIENEQEFAGHKGKTNIGYMDGKMAGTSYTHRIDLPNSQVTVGETDSDGLTSITMTYPLYKKFEDKLKIKKLNKDRYRVKPAY